MNINQIKSLYSYLNRLIKAELSQFKKNWTRLYKKHYYSSILLYSLFLFLILLVPILYIKLSTPNSLHPISLIQQDNYGGGGGSEGLDPLGVYQQIIGILRPITDNFISNTADPTGLSYRNQTGYIFNIQGYDKTQFITGITTLPALSFSRNLTQITSSFFIILLIINGFNLILSEDNVTEFKVVIKNIFSTLILLITTPTILSFSIILTNLISESLIKQNLSLELNNFILNLGKNASQLNLLTTTNPLSLILNSLYSTIINLPVLISLVLIIILFIYIFFQFIVRFINLYFLVAIHPLLIIFNLNKATQRMTQTFFKYWLSLLVQQPIFIFGFSIIEKLLLDLFNSNFNLATLLITAGFLFFLINLNSLIYRLLGMTRDVDTGLKPRFPFNLELLNITKPLSSLVHKVADYRADSLFNSLNSLSTNRFSDD